ncbi:MAG: hypothetical protein Q9180_001608 [Flavoplaca navasiana]
MSNSSGQSIPVNRFGLTEVYSPTPTKPEVDVVFVHGLNGDPHNTWTSENTKIFWPAQILPPILEDEKARVLVYGYDADVTSFTDGASRDKIHNHAEHLVAELVANRRIRKASERPIIWIAHSLGGLVVKRALIYSAEIRGIKTEHLRSIFVSTYGILFLGTPHHGSDVAQWGNRLEWICSVMLPKKVMDSQHQLIDALKTNNETLQNIDRQFIQILNRFHIYFFHEGKPTNLKGTLKFIVDETSASPTVQDVERAVIQADHSHMCKFENQSAPGFDLVVDGIQRYAEEAPARIKRNWDVENQERTTAKQAEAAELYSGNSSSSLAVSNPNLGIGNGSRATEKSELQNNENESPAVQPSKPSEPYFIVPPGFRPNTFFVGMEKEMQDLDRRLFDKRRHDGTACVLLHGQPGSGKSHLARQYVNKNRKKFAGGVFWIVSHLREEREQAYEAIFQKAVVRESPNASTKLSENGGSFIESVKAWFESRQEWLIVFDGLTVDTDADITELAKFVPDSRNSRQSNLGSKQRLLRPYAIRVPVLKQDDARKLLLKELHIKKASPEEINAANKLVRQIDCLPLAINAVSHRINDFREPLVRYTMKSFSTNPKLEGTYNQILDDLQRLGHMEAWSLINILAFFGPHVPVEMLHLGVPGLQDVQIRSTEGGGKPELNVTFGTLMRHALLERNEPDSEGSSSRDSLVEPEPIDMLKIHSVVQSFCRDSLHARNMLPEWLQHATQLLECSFLAADSKIKEKDQPARVSDYRYYLVCLVFQVSSVYILLLDVLAEKIPMMALTVTQVHCRRLHEHAMHYGSKRQSLAPISAVLEPLLDAIEAEIRALEPGSSQESINKICQVSIFDRTTSSSDSLPSIPSVNEARTPHRPSPLPLAHETLWGTDIRKPSLESPASIGSARGPRIVGDSPYRGFYDDLGYESDRETPRVASQAMRKNISERTERPPTATMEETHAEEEGWQVVPPARQSKKPRARRDLGSFRRTPARATVDRKPATGTVGRSADERMNSDSSRARKALSEVHSRSPTPPHQKLPSSLTSFWQRRPSSSMQSSRRTWANVAAGQGQHSGVQPLPSSPVQPLPSSPVPPIVPPSPTNPSVRQGNPFSSPLASEIYPDRIPNGPSLENSAHLSEGSGSLQEKPYVPAYHPSGVPYPSSTPSQPRYMNNEDLYNATQIIGPNPSRLPYTTIDDSISLSSKRRLPSDFHDSSQMPYPTASSVASSRARSPSAYPSASPMYGSYYPSHNSYIPEGYTSQPMSRNTSHQSHISVAETEPAHHPTPSTRHRRNASFSIEPPSPRDRYPNGRALRKSPRSDFAVPVGLPSSNNVSPHDLSQSLPGLGGWTMDNPHYSYTIFRSSSGPGVAIENSSGHGLGIVPFDGHLRFGEQNPISVEEARRRASEWEGRLARDRDLSRGRERRRVETGGTPYPDERIMIRYPEVNLIPTQSSPEAMRAMIGERGR